MMRLATMLAALALTTPAVAQTQAEMIASANGAFHRADRDMTAQWRTTYAQMKVRDAAGPKRGGFRYAYYTLASQRAWLAYRDAECTIEGGEFAGGSLQGLTILQCRTRLTEQRTQQLRALLWQR